MMFLELFKIVETAIKAAPKIKAAPERYAFHVKKGAGMIGGYTGKTVGGGVGAMAGGLAGGLTKGFMPAAKQSYRAAGGYDPIADFNARAAGLIPSGDKSLIHFPDIKFPEIPPFPKIPKFPDIIIPPFPKIPEFPEISIGGLDLPGLGDEEGDINPMMLVALALGGYFIIKKVT